MASPAPSGSEVVSYQASGTSVPAFVAKLWSLVDDESTNELISWGVEGKSFHLFDHFRFAKDILPLFFKHSNLSSFIRQLNMYGFRKVLNIEQGGLKVDRDDMEFQHHWFIRGQPELLIHIKRKVTQSSTNNTQSPSNMNSNQVALLQQDARAERENMEEKVDNLEMSLKVLQATQDVVNEQLVTIKRENGTLWQELSLQRQKHLKQQQITHKLLQFIMHSMLPSSSSGGSSSRNQRGSLSLGKRKFPPLMIDQPPKRGSGVSIGGESSSLTRSASIDNALEAIEDAFAASPEVQTTSGPIIREIPLETYEASVAAAAASSNGQTSSSSSTSSTMRANLQPHISNVSSTVTQPTFATAVAADGSTLLLMPTTGNGIASNPTAQSQLPFAVTSLPSQQQQHLKSQQIFSRQLQPQQQQNQQQQQQQQQIHYVVPLKTTTVPIITPADSPAEVRQAPSPAYSIHSVPSPASTSAPSPAPGPSVSPGPPPPLAPISSLSAANSPRSVVSSTQSTTTNGNKRGSTLAGKHAGKNLPPLNTSSSGTPNSNAVAAAYNKAANPNPTGTGATPEIIDTPTLTDFISQFPIMQSHHDAASSRATATTTTTIRDKTGASVKTDTLGAAVMLSGVNVDEVDDDADMESTEEAAAEEEENRKLQSPSPRGLARSLSKKIDNVDAGLEGIKDMLVAQSPDLNMDPTDLLNLFMPEGPITTDPRTPIALDDFLEGGASPFNWPSVAGGSNKALPAPEDVKVDLTTPKPQMKR